MDFTVRWDDLETTGRKHIAILIYKTGSYLQILPSLFAPKVVYQTLPRRNDASKQDVK